MERDCIGDPPCFFKSISFFLATSKDPLSDGKTNVKSSTTREKKGKVQITE